MLESAWALWTDAKVRRPLKLAAFGERAVGAVLKLYDRADDNGAELAHHFLLALCTRPGSGLCLVDAGWCALPRAAGCTTTCSRTCCGRCA